jgi:hypothetical protein
MSHGPLKEYRYHLSAPTLTNTLEQMESTLNEEGKFWKKRREYLEKRENRCRRRHVDDSVPQRGTFGFRGGDRGRGGLEWC